MKLQLNFSPGRIRAISNITSLSSILDVKVSELIYLSKNSHKYWIPGPTKIKNDGSKRLTNDALPKLKNVHEKIKFSFLKPCTFPSYINGSVPKRSVYTNAAHHTLSKIIINEDISGFFPSTDKDKVRKIWQYFFNCTPEISEILANLTTYQNQLPQGWIASSYIANLVFWDIEPITVRQLRKQGFIYTRYVDDVTLSNKGSYNKKQITDAISQINGMFLKKGYSIKRTKHDVSTQSSRQLVNNQLVNNYRVGMPKEKRKEIRAKVERLEFAYNNGLCISSVYEKNWQRVSSNVGLLKRGHPKIYGQLRERLKNIRY